MMPLGPGGPAGGSSPVLAARPAPTATGRPSWAQSAVHMALGLLAAAELAHTTLPAPLASTVVLTFALVVPGSAVVGWLARMRPTVWVLLSVSFSLAAWVLIGTVMATAHTWAPAGAVAVVADAALVAHARHAWVARPGRPRLRTDHAAVRTEIVARPAPAPLGSLPTPAPPTARPAPPLPAPRPAPAPPTAQPAPPLPVAVPAAAGVGRQAVNRVLLAVGIVGAAVALWVSAIGHVNLTNIPTTGIITTLPATYFVALALLGVGFWRAMARTRPHPLELAVYLFALLWVLYGLVPVLDPTPRYTYVYSNFAVADSIARHGGITRSVDLYQNWPGLFSAMAVVDQTAGVSPLAYANWAQLGFAALDVLAVGYVARGLTGDTRRVWATMWIALLADWIGQNYLSPQAVGYLLSLVAVGVVLHNLPAGPGPGRRTAGRRLLDRAWTVVARRPTAPIPPPVTPAMHAGAATALAVALGAAVAVTHPLSPFVLSAWLAVLVLARRCSVRWLPLAVLAITLGWFWAGHTYVFSHFRVFATIGNLSTNATGTALTFPVPPPGQQIVQAGARALSIGLWVAALVAAWLEIRRGRRPSVAVAMMVTPFFLPLLYGYGGEAIYRTYLFGVPFTAWLVAGGLLHGRLRPAARPHALHQHRHRAVAGFTVSAAMAPLFLLSFYGLLAVDVVPRSAVAVDTWFGNHASSGSVIYAVCCGFPDVVSGQYAQFRNPDGVVGGNVVPEAVLNGRPLTEADVPLALARLRAIGAPHVYVAVTPLAESTARLRGLAPASSVRRFGQLLQDSGQFRVAYRDGPSLLLELLPASPGSVAPALPPAWRGP